MSIVHIIDSVTDWARENICAKIRLKAPPEDADDPMDEAAAPDYKLVQPAAFSMFVPTREKLPPGILSPIPSVCVRIDDGGDELANGRGSANIIMMFSAYDPGTHGADLYVPVPGQPGLFKRNTGPEADIFTILNTPMRMLSMHTSLPKKKLAPPYKLPTSSLRPKCTPPTRWTLTTPPGRSPS